MILSDEQIRNMIKERGIIENYINLEKQLQPSGFDLTLDKVYAYQESGTIDFDNSKRVIAKTKRIFSNKKNGYILKLGSYLAEFNEVLKIPINVVGISNQRSSLMRNGVICPVGFWDRGYNGKGYTNLIVLNRHGFKVFRNARICQIMFHTGFVGETGYNGAFQKENIKHE